MTENKITIIAERLAAIPPLGEGKHESSEDGMCALEAAAWIAGEPWSDHPECVCPVIAEFCRRWNDGLPSHERNAILRPMVPRLVGTRGSAALAHKRSLMAADWLVREHTPAWLRLAGLIDHADTLAALPEIADMARVPSIRGALEAARRDAAAAGAAARAAARDAAWAAAWDAAGAAARAAARAAAWAAAWDAAGDAGWDAAGDAARDAGWDAAGDAARAAAWAAAWAAANGTHAAVEATLKTTRDALKQSAALLLVRMIDAKEAE